MKNADMIRLILQHPDVVKQPNSKGEATAWCPWHEDRSGGNASLTINETKGIVKCFVCDKGGVKNLTDAWGIESKKLEEPPPWEKTVTRLHKYLGPTGDLLFEVVVFGYKLDGTKDVSQRRPDVTKPDGFAWNIKGVTTVIYNLPAILTAEPTTTVYVTEGEKDVDNLTKIGVLATTNPHGASKWRKHHSPPLKGRNVVILPDNDDAGAAHAKHVAAKLAGDWAASVKILELPGLPEKGDVSDWLEAGHTAAELHSLAAGAAEWVDDGTSVETIIYEGAKHHVPARQIVADILTQGFFVEALESGEAYLFHQRRRTLIPLTKESRELQLLLNDQYRVNPRDEMFHYLREEMIHEARLRGHDATIAQHTHYEPETNVSFIDMGAGSVLRIDGGKIKMLDNGTDGVLFKPDARLQSWTYKPQAEDQALVDTLIKPLVFEESPDVPHTPTEQRLLMLVWLLSLAFESMQPTKPISVTIGPTGSGKSSFYRRAGRLLFGSRFEVNQVKKDKEAEFWTLVTNKPFVVFDNADTRVPWLEDGLATISTGIEHSTRELFTTNDMATFVPKCFVALTARTPKFRREDVASRLLLFRLDKMKEKRAERDILADVDNNRDELMSVYVNMLNRIIATERPLANEVDPSIRLADFVNLAGWFGAAFGDTTYTAVIAALNKLSESQHGYAIEENDFVNLLLEWIDRDAPADAGAMAGMPIVVNNGRPVTAGELHRELKALGETLGYPYYPNSEVALGKMIGTLAEPLTKVVDIKHERTKRRRSYTITPVDAAI